MKRCLCVFLTLVLIATMCACHGSSEPVGLSKPTHADTPTATDTDTTDATQTTQIVCESRKDGVFADPAIWSSFMGSSGLYILCHLDEQCFPGMEITYDVAARGGVFSVSKAGGPTAVKTATIYQRETVLWSGDSETAAVLELEGAIFIEFLIRADSNVVGYAIVEIGSEDANYYGMVGAETVIFPLVDGQMQDVPEIYVTQKLAQSRQQITPFDLDQYLKDIQGENLN